MKIRNLLLFVFLTVALVGFAERSEAYVDPNTGGYVFQILFPILSAIAAMWLFFKNQMKRTIRGVFKLVLRASGKKL